MLDIYKKHERKGKSWNPARHNEEEIRTMATTVENQQRQVQRNQSNHHHQQQQPQQQQQQQVHLFSVNRQVATGRRGMHHTSTTASSCSSNNSHDDVHHHTHMTTRDDDDNNNADHHLISVVDNRIYRGSHPRADPFSTAQVPVMSASAGTTATRRTGSSGNNAYGAYDMGKIVKTNVVLLPGGGNGGSRGGMIMGGGGGGGGGGFGIRSGVAQNVFRGTTRRMGTVVVPCFGGGWNEQQQQPTRRGGFFRRRTTSTSQQQQGGKRFDRNRNVIVLEESGTEDLSSASSYRSMEEVGVYSQRDIIIGTSPLFDCSETRKTNNNNNNNNNSSDSPHNRNHAHAHKQNENHRTMKSLSTTSALHNKDNKSVQCNLIQTTNHMNNNDNNNNNNNNHHERCLDRELSRVRLTPAPAFGKTNGEDDLSTYATNTSVGTNQNHHPVSCWLDLFTTLCHVSTVPTTTTTTNNTNYTNNNNNMTIPHSTTTSLMGDSNHRRSYCYTCHVVQKPKQQQQQQQEVNDNSRSIIPSSTTMSPTQVDDNTTHMMNIDAETVSCMIPPVQSHRRRYKQYVSPISNQNQQVKEAEIQQQDRDQVHTPNNRVDDNVSTSSQQQQQQLATTTTGLENTKMRRVVSSTTSIPDVSESLSFHVPTIEVIGDTTYYATNHIPTTILSNITTSKEADSSRCQGLDYYHSHQHQHQHPTPSPSKATTTNSTTTTLTAVSTVAAYPIARYSAHLNSQELVERRRRSLRKFLTFQPVHETSSSRSSTSTTSKSSTGLDDFDDDDDDEDDTDMDDLFANDDDDASPTRSYYYGDVYPASETKQIII